MPALTGQQKLADRYLTWSLHKFSLAAKLERAGEDPSHELHLAKAAQAKAHLIVA